MSKGARTGLYLALLAVALFNYLRSGSPNDAATVSAPASKSKNVVAAGTPKLQKDSPNLRIPPINREPAAAATETLGLAKLAAEAASARDPRRMQINLNLRDIELLEAAWPELRMQAIAEALPEGWLLTFVDPESVLADLGFRETDVVLKSQLVENFRGEDPELLERVERVLNYISR